MKKLIEILKGKKSYILAGVMVALGAIEAFHGWVTPEWLYAVLAGAFGLSLRAGVTKIAETMKPGQ